MQERKNRRKSAHDLVYDDDIEFEFEQQQNAGGGGLRKLKKPNIQIQKCIKRKMSGNSKKDSEDSPQDIDCEKLLRELAAKRLKINDFLKQNELKPLKFNLYNSTKWLKSELAWILNDRKIKLVIEKRKEFGQSKLESQQRDDLQQKTPPITKTPQGDSSALPEGDGDSKDTYDAEILLNKLQELQKEHKKLTLETQQKIELEGLLATNEEMDTTSESHGTAGGGKAHDNDEEDP